MKHVYIQKFLRWFVENPHRGLSAFVVLRCVMLLVLYITAPMNYTYDEIIVNSIKGQPLSQIMHILQTEPYPPLYIFLLRFLPMDNEVAARAMGTIGMSGGLVLALWYGGRRKVIEKASLVTGIFIFLMSYTVSISSVYIKAELISIPLFLLFLFAYITILAEKSVKTKDIVVLMSTATGILLTSYQPYVFTGAALGLLCLLKRNRTLYIGIAAHMLLAGVVILGFTLPQYVISSTRGTWPLFLYNSFFISLVDTIAGVRAPSVFTDVGLALSGVLVMLSMRHSIVQKNPFVYRSITILVGMCILLAYALKLFPLARYPYAVFALVSLFIGWGIDSIRMPTMRVMILCAFFLWGTTGFLKEYVNVRRGDPLQVDIVKGLQEFHHLGKTGFIADFSLLPYTLKLRYLSDDETIMPVSVNSETILEDTIITYEHLHSDYAVNMPARRPYEDVVKRLESYPVDAYIYRQTNVNFRSVSHFDPERMILDALMSNCHFIDYFRSNHAGEFYVFNNCKFTSSPVSK